MDILDDCIFVLDILKNRSNIYDLVLPDWFNMFYKDLRNLSISNNLFEKHNEYNIIDDKHQWVEILEILDVFIEKIKNENNVMFSKNYIASIINKKENIKNNLKSELFDISDIELITQELAKAVNDENYEYACLLRDKLNNLNIISDNSI
jgi:hypothetical protein